MKKSKNEKIKEKRMNKSKKSKKRIKILWYTGGKKKN